MNKQHNQVQTSELSLTSQHVASKHELCLMTSTSPKSKCLKTGSVNRFFRSTLLLPPLFAAIVILLCCGCGTKDAPQSPDPSTETSNTVTSETTKPNTSPPTETDLEVYKAETRDRLEEANREKQKLGKLIQLGLDHPSLLDDLKYRDTLDRALSNSVNYGALLSDPFKALMEMNREKLPASFAKIQESREAYHHTMLDFDSSMREAMPALISEPEISANPSKFRTAAKNFSKVNQSYNAVIKELSKASIKPRPISKK